MGGKQRRSSHQIGKGNAVTGEELTAEELSSIRRGLEDIKAGRTYAMQPDESLNSFLERMEAMK